MSSSKLVEWDTEAVASKPTAVEITGIAASIDTETLRGTAGVRGAAYGLPGIERLYGCELGEFLSLDAGGPLTIGAKQPGLALGDPSQQHVAVRRSR